LEPGLRDFAFGWVQNRNLFWQGAAPLSFQPGVTFFFFRAWAFFLNFLLKGNAFVFPADGQPKKNSSNPGAFLFFFLLDSGGLWAFFFLGIRPRPHLVQSLFFAFGYERHFNPPPFPAFYFAQVFLVFFVDRFSSPVLANRVSTSETCFFCSVCFFHPSPPRGVSAPFFSPCRTN